MILRFRFDDDMVWNLLTSHSKSKSTAAGAAVAGLHANIVAGSWPTSPSDHHRAGSRVASGIVSSRQIQRAIALIKLGASQVLESETICYERLLRGPRRQASPCTRHGRHSRPTGS